MKPTGPLVVALLLSAGTGIVGSQAAAVIVHDLANAPFNTRGRMQLKAVVSDQGSVGIAEVPPGATQAGHHHQQEQIVIVVAGQVDYNIGGPVHRVGVHGAVLTPSNSHHFYANADAGSSRFIEYQPVQRIDWQPPFPAYKVIQSPEPVAGPFARPVTSDMKEATGWGPLASGARIKSLRGESIVLRMIDLSQATAAVELTASRGTSFLFVLDGTMQFAGGAVTQEIAPDGVAQIAAGTSYSLRPRGKGPALVAIFSPLP
jgi:quercetin dioxygenase-like cupin family protein